MERVKFDMVINIGKALGEDWVYVRSDIEAVNQACVQKGKILKVIFETDYLQDEHIIRLCQICSELKVAFRETSTGYGFVKQASGDYNYKGATETCRESDAPACCSGSTGQGCRRGAHARSTAQGSRTGGNALRPLLPLKRCSKKPKKRGFE